MLSIDSSTHKEVARLIQNNSDFIRSFEKRKTTSSLRSVLPGAEIKSEPAINYTCKPCCVKLRRLDQETIDLYLNRASNQSSLNASIHSDSSFKRKHSEVQVEQPEVEVKKKKKSQSSDHIATDLNNNSITVEPKKKKREDVGEPKTQQQQIIKPKPPKITAPLSTSLLLKNKQPKLNTSLGTSHLKTITNKLPSSSSSSNFKIPKLVNNDCTSAIKNASSPSKASNVAASTLMNALVPANRPSLVKRSSNDATSSLSKRQRTGGTSVPPTTPFKPINLITARTLTDDAYLRMRGSNQPLTFNDLIQRKSQFNQSINCQHPYLSVNYLLNDYLADTTQVACLDFNMLSNAIPNDENDPLTVRALQTEQQVELCRLMSRNAGKLNFYKLAGFGNDFRECKSVVGSTEKEKKLLDQYLSLKSDEERHEFALANLNSLTVAQAYALYKAYQLKHSSSYRRISVFYNKNMYRLSDKIGKFDLKMTVENSVIDRSSTLNYASSFDDIVKFVLHERHDYADNLVRSSLSNNVALEENGLDVLKLNAATINVEASDYASTIKNVQKEVKKLKSRSLVKMIT